MAIVQPCVFLLRRLQPMTPKKSFPCFLVNRTNLCMCVGECGRKQITLGVHVAQGLKSRNKTGGVLVVQVVVGHLVLRDKANSYYDTKKRKVTK